MADNHLTTEAFADGDDIDDTAVDLTRYYDQAFPNGAKKYLKRWKGSRLEMDVEEETGDGFWKIEITPEMARDIKANGQHPW